MKSQIDFMKGNAQKSLITMVAPLLLAMILTMAYNLVDSIWVGNLLGETGYAVIFAYMHFTAVFRSFGDPVFQMKGMLISTLFNAVLAPVMIRIMGLGGAAWATVLSEVLCLVFALLYYKAKKLFRLNFHCVSAVYIHPLLMDAVPSALQACMPAVSSATMLSLVTGFGITTIAAYGVTSKLEILMFYPAMAIHMARTTIVGQCIGAGRLDRAKKYVRYALIGGILVAAVAALVQSRVAEARFAKEAVQKYATALVAAKAQA